MKHRILILLFLILFGCAPAFIINIPQNYQEYRLTSISDLYFIDIELNGKKARLLIDTGASKSLLDINKAEQYNFKYLLLAKDKYIGIGGVVDIYVTYEYRTKPFHISFLGARFDEITQYFEQDGIIIVGIIGADFLKQNGAIIDYNQNRMYIRK